MKFLDRIKLKATEKLARLTASVPQIEGVLRQLAARQRLLGETVTMKSVKRAVGAVTDEDLLDNHT